MIVPLRIHGLAGMLFLAALPGCGRQLSLAQRQSLTPDDLQQLYYITVMLTDGGGGSYSVMANFAVPSDSGPVPEALPAGDSITMNGDDLASTSTGVYAATGTGEQTAYAFVWTHGAKTYANTFTAGPSPPSTTPTTVSKKNPVPIAVAGVPAGTTVGATVNAGTDIVYPFFSVPVQVMGGGNAESATDDLSPLADGPGVLTLRETTNAPLQAATAASGSATVTVQYGYNVTITE